MNNFVKRLMTQVMGRKHLIVNTSYYLIASIIGTIIQLIINPFIALKMTHYDYAIIGYYSSFQAILLPLISFGIIQYYARNFFLVEESKRTAFRNTIVGILIIIAVTMSALSLLGLFIYFKIARVSFDFSPYAMLTISTLLFNSLYSLFIVELKMTKQAKKFLFVNVSHALISAMFAIILVIVLGLGGMGKMMAMMLTALAYFIYSAKCTITKIEIQWIYIKDVVSFCWPIASAGIFGYFVSGVDSAMLERIKDVKQFGLYSIGISLMGQTALFTTSLTNTFQPDVYRFIAEKNTQKLLYIMLSIIALGMIPMGLFIVLASPIISLLTFNRFTEAAGFARILTLKNVTIELYYIVVMILEGYGYTKSILVTRIIGAVFVALMFKIMIGSLGFYGAAWGQVISPLLMILVMLIYLLLLYPKNVHKKLKQLAADRNN